MDTRNTTETLRRYRSTANIYATPSIMTCSNSCRNQTNALTNESGKWWKQFAVVRCTRAGSRLASQNLSWRKLGLALVVIVIRRRYVDIVKNNAENPGSDIVQDLL